MDVNVWDYAEIKARGMTGAVSGSTITQTGAFTGVSDGDTLWIMNGIHAGSYLILSRTNNTATVQSASWATEGDLEWKVTATLTLRHRAAGNAGSVAVDSIYENGAFSGVSVDDTLWIQSGENIGMYEITAVDPDFVTVAYESWASATGVRWKITAGSPYDCTSDFQNALDAVFAAGGGVVNVPTGFFYFAGTLTISSNVLLKGMHDVPPRWAPVPWLLGGDQGPVLCPTSGMGDDGTYEDPFITLFGHAYNAGVEGLMIYYPLQGIVNDSQDQYITMMPYPWCISIDTEGGCRDHRVRNVMLVNPYKGIRAVDAETRAHISGVFGCPLTVGIWIDGVTDFCTLERVHFHPDFWRVGNSDVYKSLCTFLAKNLTAIELGKVDALTISDAKAWILNKGLVLHTSGFGNGPWFSGLNIKFDACNVGIDVSAAHSNQVAANGNLVNCEIIAGTLEDVVFDYENVYDVQETIHATGTAYLRWSGGVLNCAGEGKAVNWAADGWLVISDTLFINNPHADIAYGVYASNGRISVQGCLFQHNGDYGGYGYTECIHLTSGAEKGIVFGNDYRTSPPGTNSAEDREIFTSGKMRIQNEVGNSGLVLQSTTAGNTPYLTFKDHSDTTAKTYSMRYNTSDEKLYIGEGDASFSPQVTISRATGNMGVGTTGPSEKLEVSGNAKVTGSLETGGIKILSGTGNPSTSAPSGSLYLRTDGGSINTLWVRRGSSWYSVTTD